MSDRLETKKFVFTVEGETEKWYLEWLRDRINECGERTYNVAIEAKVQQSPKKFYKTVNAKTTPEVFHICDVESNEKVHVDKFKNILSEMKEAQTQKRIKYRLGYSNFTFELWIVLHKKTCNGCLIHRRQYLDSINRVFGEHFENLDQYKREDEFKRCLGKLSLDNVKEAICRSNIITSNNERGGKVLEKYKGYSYYRDNPALSIHDAVSIILTECGV